MKAVVANAIGPYAEVLSLQTVPELELAEGTALVRVLSAGLAFPDVLVVEGKHMMRRDPPFTPGQEVCGQVVAIGEGVTSLAVGQHVFGPCLTGGLAEFALVSADDCFKAPSGMDPHVAAGFELNYGTSWHGLVDLAALRRDETLLVLGASGGVGMAAIDLGVALGAEVIACASTAAKLAACERAGATTLINYTEGNFKQALKDAGVYGGVDVVYDPVGGKFSEPAMRSLGWGGRHVVIGFAAGGATPKAAIPALPLNLALLNEREILGCFWGAWKMRDGNVTNRQNINTMLEMVASGKMRPLVSRVYQLRDYASAFDAMMSRRVVGKITIRVSPEPSRL